MRDVEKEVFAFLDGIGVEYRAIHHEPVRTMEDCEEIDRRLGAGVPKNLLLTPRNKSAYYLLLLRDKAVFKTASISKQVGSARLSFAGEEDMMRLISTKPGAVSPMGLLFDEERQVTLLIDRALRGEEKLAFHPSVNTASFSVSGRDFFEKILPAMGREPVYVDVEE